MNLLVLCTDTFRADYLGCYGSDWVETPYLDKMAAEGVRFDEFYAEGLPTLPVRRVFYTGRRVFPFSHYPQKSDLVQLPGWHPMFEEDVTLAEWLSDRGYATGLISDVYHQFKPGKNFHRGFHSWQWIRGQETDRLVPTTKADMDLSRYVPASVPEDAPGRRMVAQYLNNRAWWKSEADHYAAQAMRAAADWLKSYGSAQPWMLWVESFDPHEPWDAPAEFVAKYSRDYDGVDLLWAPGRTDHCTEAEFNRIKAQYAGECSHVDKWCGHVLDTLDSLGMRDDTVVVFTSDHGTMMGEQGEIHKGIDRLRIQVTRSPLIVRHPDRALAGQVVDGIVQHQDLMPTLLHLLGEPVPERCDGMDAWPMVTEGAPGRDFALSAFGWHASARTKEWNYQAAWAEPARGKVRPPELYDRRSDPDELQNVVEEHPEAARELQARIDEAIRGHQATVGETETPAAVPGIKW